MGGRTGPARVLQGTTRWTTKGAVKRRLQTSSPLHYLTREAATLDLHPQFEVAMRPEGGRIQKRTMLELPDHEFGGGRQRFIAPGEGDWALRIVRGQLSQAKQ